jgi:hypothetical protein
MPLKQPRLRTRVHRKPHHRDVAVYLEFSSIPKFVAFCNILRGATSGDAKIRAMNARLSRATTTLTDAERQDQRTANREPRTVNRKAQSPKPKA